MSLLLLIAPAVKPLSLTELRSHLRIAPTDTTDDAYITTLLESATEQAEIVTGRAFITQTLKLVRDGFPGSGIISLERPPLQSVTSIKYLDTTGVQQTLSTDVYSADIISSPGRIILKAGQSWPSTADQENAVEIEYVAGYGDDAADVPAPLRHGIRALVAHWYSNREPIISGHIVADVPMTVDYLLLPHKAWRPQR